MITIVMENAPMWFDVVAIIWIPMAMDCKAIRIDKNLDRSQSMKSVLLMS